MFVRNLLTDEILKVWSDDRDQGKGIVALPLTAERERLRESYDCAWLVDAVHLVEGEYEILNDSRVALDPIGMKYLLEW
jgi:hypothetical protein